MSVWQREPPEYDIMVGPHDKLQRVLIFPWRAEHDEANYCNWGSVFYGQAEAEHALVTHTCRQTYKRRNGVSIAERYWLELDRIVNSLKAINAVEINSTDLREEALVLRGRAQGLAFALVIACQPHYADEKAVSREAAARWKMHNGQLDYRPTPGFKYDPPIPGTNPQALGQPDGDPATYTKDYNQGSGPAIPTSGRRRRAAAAEKHLSDMEKETIRKAGTAFPVKDLAGMYGVTEAVINAVLAEHEIKE